MRGPVEHVEHVEHVRAPVEHVEVAILGAGFAGIGLGIRLARRGFRSFAILERAGEVGGTWRDNTYPGVACDIPSHLYSFSFRQKPDWSHVFPAGAEIQDYLRESVREEGLLPHLRLNTEMVDARWDDAESHWVIETTRGTCIARVLVSAAGRLSDPFIPQVHGLDAFSGQAFHSSAWRHDLDLAGKRIGVVGTGASAVQIVPELAAVAGELVVFQRTPAWVLPREDHAYSAAERHDFAQHPEALNDSRQRFFEEAEQGFEARAGDLDRIDALRARALGNLEGAVSDPKLRALLAPDYEIGCKRVPFSNQYYPALTAEQVTLEPSALASVEGSVAHAGSGASYDLDVIVFATGYHASRPPFAERVTGRSGKRLSDHWAAGMTAFASTVVNGYPNLFIIDGPNASLGHNSAIYMIEVQIDYILGALEFRDESGVDVLDVSPDAEAAYTRFIDERSQATVWLTGGCASWYVDERSGRLTLLWPGRAREFRETNGTFDPAPYLQVVTATADLAVAGADFATAHGAPGTQQ